MKIINFKEKIKELLKFLTKKQQESYENVKFKDKYAKD